jgi:hypothetical protein
MNFGKITLPLEIMEQILILLDMKSFICFCISSKNYYNKFYNEDFIKIYLKYRKQTIWSFIHYSRNNKLLFSLINNSFYSQNKEYWNLIKNDKLIVYTTFTNIYKYNPDILVFLSYYGYSNISLVYFFISKKEYYIAYIIYSFYKTRIYKHFISVVLLLQENNTEYYKEKLYKELYDKMTGFEKYLIDCVKKRKLNLLE